MNSLGGINREGIKGRERGVSWLLGAGGEALFCVLYLLSMANVYKNQSSGAGGGGVGKEGIGGRPWASILP